MAVAIEVLMNIRIPRFVVRAWDRLGDWSNVPLWTRGRLEVRRIDIILALGFIGCVTWYAITAGWQTAIMGGVMYLVVMAMALWLL
jgi:hypothetical protein